MGEVMASLTEAIGWGLGNLGKGVEFVFTTPEILIFVGAGLAMRLVMGAKKAIS